MSLDVASIAALTLCLCVCTSAIPEDDFYGKGTETLDVQNDENEMTLPSFGSSFVRLERCRDLGRIRVRMCVHVSLLYYTLVGVHCRTSELFTFRCGC